MGLQVGQRQIDQVPTLPLVLGSLGAIDANKIFDPKMATDRYQFDGNKGGDTWTRGISDYFKACRPAVREIFRWVERIPEDIVLTDNLLNVAAGNTLQWQQQRNINSAMYSFLTLSVSGEANTIPRGQRK